MPKAFILEKEYRGNLSQYLLYIYSDQTVWIEKIVNCAGEGYIFKGEIKNKSELKKLMKQIRICQ